MALSEDDKREIREIFFDVLKTHYEESGCNMATHTADHLFILEWRQNAQTMRKAGLTTLITVAVAGLLGFIWTAIKWG